MDGQGRAGSSKILKVRLDWTGVQERRQNRGSEKRFLSSDPVLVTSIQEWQFKSVSKHDMFRGLSTLGNNKKFKPTVAAHVYLMRWERPNKFKGQQMGKTIPGASVAALIGDKFSHRWILWVLHTKLKPFEMSGITLVKTYHQPFSCIQLAHDVQIHHSRNKAQGSNAVVDAIGVIKSWAG